MTDDLLVESLARWIKWEPDLTDAQLRKELRNLTGEDDRSVLDRWIHQARAR